MPLPGSKPKKLSSRPKKNNPTYISDLFMCAINPELQYLSVLKNKSREDSLDQAVQNFQIKQQQKEILNPSMMNNRNSSPRQLSKKQLENTNIVGPFNYFSTIAIKNKQYHGYNIINNF